MFWICIMFPAIHKEALQLNNERVKLQWHPAFCCEDKGQLEFYSEYNLSRKPLQIDLLIVEKANNVKLKNQIGHIFRKNNIIEYKCPGDSMSIDDFYKTVAYACMYKALGEKVDAVSASELTISMVRESYPESMAAMLKKQGIEIRKVYEGIYYLENFFIPAQIVVTKELSQGLHNSFRVLSRNVDEKDIETFLKDAEGYIGKSEKSDADAVLQVSMSANYELYEKVRRDNTMCEALRRLMRDEIEDALDAAKQEGSAEGHIQAQRETSMALAKMGMAVENIATAVNASIEQVQSWINAKDNASAI